MVPSNAHWPSAFEQKRVWCQAVAIFPHQHCWSMLKRCFTFCILFIDRMTCDLNKDDCWDAPFLTATPPVSLKRDPTCLDQDFAEKPCEPVITGTAQGSAVFSFNSPCMTGSVHFLF